MSLNKQLLDLDKSVENGAFYSDPDSSIEKMGNIAESLTGIVCLNDLEGLSSDFLKTMLGSSMVMMAEALRTKCSVP